MIYWIYRQHGDKRSPTIEKSAPDPVQIAQLATRVRAGKLYLTHLRNNMDTEDAHREVRAHLANHFTGDAYIAQDLMTIEL